MPRRHELSDLQWEAVCEVIDKDNRLKNRIPSWGGCLSCLLGRKNFLE